MLTDYYRPNLRLSVARPPARPYVPVRARIAAPFLTAYAPKPAVAPVPVEFAAAFAKLMEQYRWIEPYTRKSGITVKGHLRGKAGA